MEKRKASLVAEMVKTTTKKNQQQCLPMQEIRVQSLCQEDLPEEETATHSSILVWRMPMDRGAWQATVHGVAKSQT